MQWAYSGDETVPEWYSTRIPEGIAILMRSLFLVAYLIHATFKERVFVHVLVLTHSNMEENQAI